MLRPRSVNSADLAAWWSEQGEHGCRQTAGLLAEPEEHLQRLGVPDHLALLIQRLPREQAGGDALESIPFYALCRGLFLPLLMLEPARSAALFGVATPRVDSARRESVVREFLGKPLGLTVEEKLGCLFCDPFLGRASTLRQDMLLRILMGVQLAGRTWLLQRLAQVKDVAVLYAESRRDVRGSPPLTAAEVLRSVRLSRDEPLGRKLRVLRSLLSRCGKLEAFVLAKLLLGKNGPGLGVPAPGVARALADCYGAPLEHVRHAAALTDMFRVARALEEHGADGLRAIRLQPLSPVRPALAGGSVEQQEQFPVWVERKYDGVRFLLHKSTGAQGSVLCGAYTRNGNDWLELVRGLDQSIRLLPAASLILDCELYGLLPGDEGLRPATVYEVVSALKGDAAPLSLRLAAFDVLYINGEDVTQRPLRQRQLIVSNLCAALAGLPMPVPIRMAQGQIADSADDVNRLYRHFRSQGYEGVITKLLDAPYLLGGRDPNWRKRKPEVTLDVVLLGATYSASERHQGAFGSYVLGALREDGGFEDIGDVDGVDRDKDRRIQQLIMRDGLITGNSIERKLTEGSRIGMELRPGIVVTVVFQDVMRESEGVLQLRHPRIKVIRSDKTPEEVDTVATIEQLHRYEQLQ